MGGGGGWARQSKVNIDLTMLLSRSRHEGCLFCVYHIKVTIVRRIKKKPRNSENMWLSTLGYEFVC